MVNKYYKRLKISKPVFRHLIKCFAQGLTATETAHLSFVSLRSITVIFDKLRGKIAKWCEQSALFTGPIEVDESYFGPGVFQTNEVAAHLVRLLSLHL